MDPRGEVFIWNYLNWWRRGYWLIELEKLEEIGISKFLYKITWIIHLRLMFTNEISQFSSLIVSKQAEGGRGFFRYLNIIFKYPTDFSILGVGVVSKKNTI